MDSQTPAARGDAHAASTFRRSATLIALSIVGALTTVSLSSAQELRTSGGSSPSAQPEQRAFPFAEHLDQHALVRTDVAKTINWGGMLFGTSFNRLDGVGANLSGDPQGSIRFTRFPRMDLPGFGGNPIRTTGPNSQSCVGCHDVPFTGGGGGVHDAEIRDSLRTGDPQQYVQRNPLHLFGAGAVQLLAEQATAELKSLRDGALARARSTGQRVDVDLTVNGGVSYGRLSALTDGRLDVSAVRGVDPDLVVRPYTWKGGFFSFLRPFVSIGTEQELGMPPVEFFGDGTDSDSDGVTNEMSVGDVTAMTMWIASLPRPVTQLELSQRLGGHHMLPVSEIAAIKRGEQLFGDVGCASCHRPSIRLKDPVFREPSRMIEYRFPQLPSGADPVAVGLDPAHPIAVSLAANPQLGSQRNDQRCRFVEVRHSRCFLQYESDGESIIVRTYGDLKRHDMGPGLAENIDEAGTGRQMWKTRELWGVGNTGPWLHDGRATTLDEAIRWHGGEGQASRDQYAALGTRDRALVVRFLQNLVLFDARDRHDD